MKRFEIVDSFGDKIVVEAELGLYTAYDFLENKMPNLGIQLYSYDEDGEREEFDVLSVNFGEFLSAKDCMYIDTNNCSYAHQFLEMGICQDTGFTKESGMCTYPLWKFDKEFLKEIDVDGLYSTYEEEFDKYMNEGPKLPLENRQGEVIEKVIAELGIDGDVKVWTNLEDGKIYSVSIGDNTWPGVNFCRYLLAEVCDYDKQGAVKGLSLALCNDFYDVCKMNGVSPQEYNKPFPVRDTEYVITMSSGGGTVRDFMTLGSKEEAEEICEGYGWEFMDENEFVWELDVDEREVSLAAKLDDAKHRSEVCKGEELSEVDFDK